MNTLKAKLIEDVVTSISYEYDVLRNEDVKNGVNMSGRNQSDVKYVIRLNIPVHVWGIHWKDVNATLRVTDGRRFVSLPAKRVHKGHKFLNDAVCGCSACVFVCLII